MDVTWGAILLAIITSAVGSVGIWETVRYLLARKSHIRVAEASVQKTEAEAASLMADADSKALESANRMIDSLTAQYARLEKRINEQNDRIDTQDDRLCQLETKLARYARRIEVLMDGIKRLHEQIHSLGTEPIWTPDDWNGG